jgi:hypothetical protein|tara:strand:- start:1276 stop:1530 length:255 start_codon:yes stop_codon:yes gene_type:complete
MKWNGGSNTANLSMKKFLITSDTVANGKKVYAGDVVELNEGVGHELCAYGKAQPHIEKPIKESVNRSVGLKKSSTKPTKKRTKK